MIDHLMWAAPELEAGRRDMEARLGVPMEAGGRHPGVGTHNVLLGLGSERYMEVIAPDPTQDRCSSFGEWVWAVTSPTLLTWCARSDDLEGLQERARARGLETSPIASMQRQRPDGSLLRWRLLFLEGHRYGLSLPFFIDWQDSPHPGKTLPPVLTLKYLRIEHPEAESLQSLLEDLLQGPSADVAFHPTPDANLRAELETPQGSVVL